MRGSEGGLPGLPVGGKKGARPYGYGSEYARRCRNAHKLAGLTTVLRRVTTEAPWTRLILPPSPTRPFVFSLSLSLSLSLGLSRTARPRVANTTLTFATSVRQASPPPVAPAFPPSPFPRLP